MTAAKKTTKVKKAGSAAKKTAKKVTETAKNNTDIMERKMTQGKAKLDNIANDLNKSGKEQMDAFMQAGNVFMKGFETIAKTSMTLAQDAAEKNSQAVKSFIGCKTINEYAEAHNKWAQQSFDDFMSGATKLSELSVKIATETFEPINDQLHKTISKATEAATA